MELSPSRDPAKYRTKRYMPNNSLVVQGSSDQLTKRRNLSELANRSSPKDCDGESETVPLVKPTSVGSTDKPKPIKFVLANDLTKGSVAVEGENVAVGAKDSDGIYRVVLHSH